MATMSSLEMEPSFAKRLWMILCHCFHCGVHVEDTYPELIFSKKDTCDDKTNCFCRKRNGFNKDIFGCWGKLVSNTQMCITSRKFGFNKRREVNNIDKAKVYGNVLPKNFSEQLVEERLISLGIGGMGKQFFHILQRAFCSRVASPAEAKGLNLKHVRGMLLYGPPGCGKTMLAKHISKFLIAKEPLFISILDLLDGNKSSSIRRIKSFIKEAIADEKRYGTKSDLHIVVIDDIDGIAVKKERVGSKDAGYKILEKLFEMTDGPNALSNFFIVATTNRKDLVDESVLRQGRIELHVKIDYPDEEQRLQILKTLTSIMRVNGLLDEDVDLQEIARETEGGYGASLASLVSDALTCAIYSFLDKEGLELNADNIASAHHMDNFKVTMSHYRHCLKQPKIRDVVQE